MRQYTQLPDTETRARMLERVAGTDSRAGGRLTAMELWNAILARKAHVLLGILLTAGVYGALHMVLDEYVTVLAGAAGAGAGYLAARRGSSGPLDDARSDDAFAWSFGALVGVLAMHTLAQGGVI